MGIFGVNELFDIIALLGYRLFGDERFEWFEVVLLLDGEIVVFQRLVCCDDEEE